MEEPVGEAYVSQNEDLAFADVTFEKGSKDTAVAFPKDAPVLTEKVNASIKQINDQKLMDGYKKANQLMFQKIKAFYKSMESSTLTVQAIPFS